MTSIFSPVFGGTSAASGGGGYSSTNQGTVKEAYYLSTLSAELNTMVNGQKTVGNLEWIPFSFSVETTFNRIGLNVNTNVAGVMRLGLFTADFDAGTMTLVTDFGTVDTSSNGDKEITINETIPAGNYYIGSVPSGNGGYFKSINDPVNGGSIHGSRTSSNISNTLIYKSGQTVSATGGFLASYSFTAGSNMTGFDPMNVWLRRDV